MTSLLIILLTLLGLVLANPSIPPYRSMLDQEPKGIHVVYQSSNNYDMMSYPTSPSMTIVWHTHVPINTALVYYSLIEPEFEYEPVDTLACKHTHYEKGFIGRVPLSTSANSSGVYVHRVYLRNLEPDRKYCYEVTSGAASSHIYSFRTAPPTINVGIVTASSFEHGSFLVSADLAQFFNRNQNLLDLEINRKLNGLISLNRRDNSGGYNLLVNSSSGEKRIFNFVPSFPTLETVADTNSLLKYMYPLLIAQYPLNSSVYSFDSNGVHFVTFSLLSSMPSLASSLDFNMTESQKGKNDLVLEWLERDLKTANENRHLVPWLIVYVPVKSSFNDSVYFKRIETLFYEYDVDLIFELSNSNGNVYERTFPVVRSIQKFEPSYVKPDMPIRVAMPWFQRTPCDMSMQQNENETILEDDDEGSQEEPKWIAFSYEFENLSNNSAVYGLLEVVNSTALTWSLFAYANQTLIDKFKIIKDHNGEFSRVFNARKYFLEHNGVMRKDSLTITAFRKVRLAFMLCILAGVVAFSATIFFNHIRKYLSRRRQAKLNLMNYSNLIESEFDA